MAFKLPKWLNPFKKPEKMSMSTQDLAAFLSGGVGSSVGIAENYGSQAKEAYKKNVIVYVAVSRIAAAVSDLPYQVFVDAKELTAKSDKGIKSRGLHPVLKLLKQPNPLQTYREFMRWGSTYGLISGNLYMRGNVLSSGKLYEIDLLRPDRVELKVKDGRLNSFEYSLESQVFKYPIDPLTLDSDILHIKDPNPLDDLYGMSPITAASLGISQNNKLSEWNGSLLDNSARPSGLVSLKSDGTGGPGLEQEQLDDIASRFNQKYFGKENAGKVLFLTGDMEWKTLGMSPKEMDWVLSKSTTARDIALAFGYPPYLLGMAEGSTFNNVSEARLSLYQETVIPLARRILEGLSSFLSRKFGQEIEVKLALDQVEALAPFREGQRKQSREDFSAGIDLNELN